MSFKRYLVPAALLSCITLTGCGGSGEKEQTPPVVTTPDPTPEDTIDYVAKVALAANVAKQSRAESVAGIVLDSGVNTGDLESISLSIKARVDQEFWIYLQGAEGQTLGKYQNASATTEWQTITIVKSDFESVVAGSVTSIEFYLGTEISSDTHSNNTFFIDDVTVKTASSEVVNSVDETGTGWSTGIGLMTSFITQEASDEAPVTSWALKAELPGTTTNRWDAIVGHVLESTAHIDQLTTITFDVKADKQQGFWVYLRDANDNDIGAHYNTSAHDQWQTITLNPTDFSSVSSADIYSVQFFVGANSDDQSLENAFYFDNLRVLTESGDLHGEAASTDEYASGWLSVGKGTNNFAVYRDPSTVIAPPPTSVVYDIEYQREAGTDYFVSPQGSDDNDGLTENSPFLTPQKAADMVSAGDRILLMPGTYESQAYEAMMSISAVGTPTNWISVEPQVPDSVIFQVNGSMGIEVNGGAYVRIKGIQLKGIADTITPEEADRRREENWYSIGLVGNGIGTETRKDDNGDYHYPHHIIVEDNFISWMSGGCIGIKRADYILIKDNEVHHCGLYNVWAQSGISVWENHNYDDNTATYRTVITGNISYDNYNHFKFYASSDPNIADSYTDGNGIIIDALAIDQGYLSDGQSGVYSGRTLIENNIVYNNGGKGINIYASDNIDVIHNTAYKNGQHPEIPAEVGLMETSNVRMYNNIIYAADDEPMFFSYQTQNVHISNNIMIKDVGFSDGDKMELVIDYIEADPKFAAADLADFTLNADSPAIDAGNSLLKSLVDINGNPRPAGGAVDIGPFEQ